MKKAILLSAVIFTLLFSIACHYDPLEEGDLFVSLDGKYLVSPNDLEDNSNTVKSGYFHTYTYFENYKGYAFGTTFMNDAKSFKDNWVSSYTGYFCMGDYYYTMNRYTKVVME